MAPRLATTTSQHALTTQHINFPPNQPTVKRRGSLTRGPTMASVMTYFTATHFGKGGWAGHTLTVYGKYIDELVRVAEDDEAYDGLGSEQWRICRREVKFMARVGEERIMVPGIAGSGGGAGAGQGGRSADGSGSEAWSR